MMSPFDLTCPRCAGVQQTQAMPPAQPPPAQIPPPIIVTPAPVYVHPSADQPIAGKAATAGFFGFLGVTAGACALPFIGCGVILVILIIMAALGAGHNP